MSFQSLLSFRVHSQPETAPRFCPTCSQGVGPAWRTHAARERGSTGAALWDSGKKRVSLRHHRFTSSSEANPPGRGPVTPLSTASFSGRVPGYTPAAASSVCPRPNSGPLAVEPRMSSERTRRSCPSRLRCAHAEPRASGGGGGLLRGRSGRYSRRLGVAPRAPAAAL